VLILLCFLDTKAAPPPIIFRYSQLNKTIEKLNYMNKFILLHAFAAILFISSKIESNQFKITGEAEGFTDSTMLYLIDPEKGVYLDSVYITNSKFVFSGIIEESQKMFIATSFYNQKDFEGVILWVEPKEMTMKVKKGKFLYAELSGSVLQDQALSLNKATIPIELSIDSIQKIMMSLYGTDDMNFEQLIHQRDSLFNRKTELEKQYIIDHPDFLNSAELLLSIKQLIPKEEALQLYNNLSISNKASKYGTKIKNYLVQSREFKIGDGAVDFQLKNINDETVSLSDFKQKYVLLEFWGSGCASCRAENPNLLKN